MKPESYEAVSRVPGSYEEFRRGVDLLRSEAYPSWSKGRFCLPNRGEMDAFEAWAATLPAMDRPPAYAMFFDLRGRRDSPAKNRLIERLRLTPEEGVAMLHRGTRVLLQEMRRVLRQIHGTARGPALFLRRRARRLRRCLWRACSPACRCATRRWCMICKTGP